ncbi:MAG TPA: O-methyltransferase [Cyclobacteriaceae bacterium]|jgi:caffeoyl-CoA O-methyltransferase|nr:O-methyltransferase [Cyclobacteriaceae bacterium]
MDILNKGLLQYSEEHTTLESELLKKINRDTHSEVTKPRMLSGHLQGRVLAMISRMINPAMILEIGTYTGYSAICLAEGLSSNGKLITLDINEELEDRVRTYIKEAGLETVIDFQVGNALHIIPTLTSIFDLVFIDADKENYSNYFDLIFDKVAVGGFILADNVLWSGKVLDPKPDKDTRAILEFNRKIQNDERVENILLPVRDGVMLIRKVQS